MKMARQLFYLAAIVVVTSVIVLGRFQFKSVATNERVENVVNQPITMNLDKRTEHLKDLNTTNYLYDDPNSTKHTINKNLNYVTEIPYRIAYFNGRFIDCRKLEYLHTLWCK